MTSTASMTASTAAGAPAMASRSERILDHLEDPLAAALYRELGEDPLARAPRRAGAELERSPHAAGHLLRLLRLDQDARVAHHLGHRGHVHHHRDAAREHRLRHGEAEALVARCL